MSCVVGVAIVQCWKPELEYSWSFGVTVLVKDYWYFKTSLQSIEPSNCRVVGLHLLWAWLLGEVEQGEFDCTYPTPPLGQCWAIRKHHSGGGKTQS